MTLENTAPLDFYALGQICQESLKYFGMQLATRTKMKKLA